MSSAIYIDQWLQSEACRWAWYMPTAANQVGQCVQVVYVHWRRGQVYDTQCHLSHFLQRSLWSCVLALADEFQASKHICPYTQYVHAVCIIMNRTWNSLIVALEYSFHIQYIHIHHDSEMLGIALLWIHTLALDETENTVRAILQYKCILYILMCTLIWKNYT